MMQATWATGNVFKHKVETGLRIILCQLFPRLCDEQYFVDEVPRPSTLAVLKQGGKRLRCAEVGVAYGENAESILSVLPVETLYLIDPYTDYTINYWNQVFHVSPQDQERRLVTAKLRLVAFKKKCVWMRQTSFEAAEKIADDSLDFVYLDGAKTIDIVRKDLALYYSKLRIGGVLAGHDFSGDWQTVTRAVMEFADKNNLVLNTKKVDWWMYKQ
jgi:hypothetical protein